MHARSMAAAAISFLNSGFPTKAQYEAWLSKQQRHASSEPPTSLRNRRTCSFDTQCSFAAFFESLLAPFKEKVGEGSPPSSPSRLPIDDNNRSHSTPVSQKIFREMNAPCEVNKQICHEINAALYKRAKHDTTLASQAQAMADAHYLEVYVAGKSIGLGSRHRLVSPINLGDAARHNLGHTLCQADTGVLQSVIEFLRAESGAQLRKPIHGVIAHSNSCRAIDLSLVCKDWRAINIAAAQQWLSGLKVPTIFDWHVPNFSQYMQGPDGGPKPLSRFVVSPKFLRGSQNYVLSLSCFDSAQFNEREQWLPKDDAPDEAKVGDVFSVVLSIADAGMYTGSSGELTADVTVHHRDPKKSIVKTTRNFELKWTTEKAVLSPSTGRFVLKHGVLLNKFVRVETLKGDKGFLLGDELSITLRLTGGR